METEENYNAEVHYLKSVEFFKTLPDEILQNFNNYLQELNNSLGYLCANYDKNDEAFKYLKDSKAVYKKIMASE